MQGAACFPSSHRVRVARLTRPSAWPIAQSKLRAAKQAIRELMRVLADMYARYRPLAYSEDGIDASAIACSKCGGEDTDGPLGDIVLCDARGCDHAFHMRCVSPPLEPAALEGADEDDDWLCPRCGERGAG